MTLFQIFATEFLNAFTNDNPRKVWCLKDDAPEWMRDAIRDAHFDGRMPDDWIYEHARAIVSQLADLEAPDGDTQHEICDGLVDVYTSDLTAWLALHTGNVELCDEAQREGLTTEGATLVQRIQAAQYMALTYICGALVGAIESHAAEADQDVSSCGKCGDEYEGEDCPRCHP